MNDGVADRIAIEQQLARYCRAIDTGDWDLLDAVFAPDAILDYTSPGGIRGAFPEVKAWLAQVLPLFPIRQHYVTNVEVDITGDTAISRAYLYNPMGRRGDDGQVSLFVTGGVYRDQWRRTPGGWRIVERVETELWRDLR
jgi:hypothetical protein